MLLCDRLLKQPVVSITRAYVDAMRLPSRNHVADAIPVALVDRFVIDPDNFQNRIKALAAEGVSMQIAFENARSPLPKCWIESGNLGFFVDADRADMFQLIAGGGAKSVVPLWRFSLNNIRNSNAATVDCEGLYPGELRAVVSARLAGQMLAVLLCALGSHRVVSTKRVVPAAQSGAAMRSLQRKWRRGIPTFSYNKVELILPREDVYRGDLKECEGQSGKRLHAVIAHWRLIDGVVTPFWTWVDGHARGDEALGVIVKERHIAFRADLTRRGFMVPATEGHRGQRVDAERPL